MVAGDSFRALLDKVIDPDKVPVFEPGEHELNTAHSMRITSALENVAL